MRRFVEWDQLEVRINGEKLNALVASFRVDPIERLEVRFENALMRDRLPADLVGFEDPATLVFSLDRFLPNFVDAEIQRVWIIDGGLVVTLGRGGADLPAG